MDMVPAGVVIPAMYEINVIFAATRRMRCEYMVRVRDSQDQLLHREGDTEFRPRPELFMPMIMGP
jgi:hypothetical protein